MRSVEVLVVEDDPHTLQACVRMLGSAERRAQGVSGVRAAKRAVRRLQPKIGVVDYLLPDGSGIDLIRWWRREDPRARLVLATAHGDLAVGFAARNAGADAVLDKPFGAVALLACLVSPRTASPAVDELASSADAAEYAHAMRVLDECGGNKALALRVLGKSRGWLDQLIERGPPRR